MVTLKIYVLVCASKEQFPNKSVFIKTVLVTSSNLQSTFQRYTTLCSDKVNRRAGCSLF